MSLRPPQRASLEILNRLVEIAPPSKELDLDSAIAAIGSEFPRLTDFEREFASVCFALATGVGKTRLMGAFMAYLYLTGKSRHFFVLAPNLTIYDKLIADFTPGTKKYVFQGISEFVTAPPVIITGDNYESGVGVREDARRQLGLFRPGGEDAIHINVFNISKISSDVRASQRGNKPPRIKRLSEYIGESYFEYLSKLPDLVLLMDESHRYRADAGTKALNDLRPILGLELTATPFIETNRAPVVFKNIVYSYPLAEAIRDGFVKEPAVATRKNFSAKGLSDGQIERIKLEDGIRLHEQVKADLKIYADQNGKHQVKPFMLVVARNIDHASQLVSLFKSNSFFGGRYADKVIEVHTALKGEEKEDAVKALLAVESPDEPTEVVIHVNMLKEGWDVTNLYTIVPLNPAHARTLIEQSIGRGLRLPYGRRTGVKAVDRLTIVAHDNFQAIVDEANRGDSIIRKIEVVELDPDDDAGTAQPVEVRPVLDQILAGGTRAVGAAVSAAGEASPPPAFTTPASQAVAKATVAAIADFERLPSSADLLKPDTQARLVAKVQAGQPSQAELFKPKEVEKLVREATATYIALSIDIPTVVVVPKGEVAFGYDDFDLDTSVGFNLEPVAEDILIQHLQSNLQERLGVLEDASAEELPENYIVRALIDYDDVDYDTHSALLYRLAGQAVAYLRSRLQDEASVRNVLLYYQPRLADLIHAQMEKHRWERSVGFDVKVTRGFRRLTPATVSQGAGEEERNFRHPLDNKRDIGKMIFGGFAKCLYPLQKFESDPERRLAVILENDTAVLKWVKPAKGNFQISWRGGQLYEPDFVVETETGRFLVEVKRADLLQDSEVLAKAGAAQTWCEHATAHAIECASKPWTYILVPDLEISEAMTLEGLVARFRWPRK